MKKFLIIPIEFLEKIIIFIFKKLGIAPIIKYGEKIEDSILQKIESQIIGYSRFLASFSTGAIVLSFTIINSFERVEDLKFPIFLIISWLFFGISILMGAIFENSLTSFKIKIGHVAILNAKGNEKGATEDSQENWHSFNNWGVQADPLQKITFLIAISCLIFFIFVNFYQYSDLLNWFIGRIKYF